MDQLQRTACEQGLYDIGLTELSDLMVRTGDVIRYPTSPFVGQVLKDNFAFYAVAHQINLPLLFFAADIIRRLHPDQWIGFLGRDCYLLEQIYRYYFDCRCSYVPFSRLVAARDRTKAVEYLQSFGCDVLVDFSSTGKTWEHLAAQHSFNIRVFIYSDLWGYGDLKPVPPSTFTWIAKNSQIGETTNVVEFFNSADTGMLLNVDPMEYGKPELPDNVITAIHDPVIEALKSVHDYPRLTAQLRNMSDRQIASVFEKFLMTLCDQQNIVNLVPTYKTKNNQVTGLLKDIFAEIKKNNL